MLSEKFLTCSKCGKKAPEVLSFTIGDQVVCHSCEPPKKLLSFELDVQVAEKVMGLRKNPDVAFTWLDERGWTAFDTTGPRWSSDIAAAMRVFDRMRDLGHRWLLNADAAGFHLRHVAYVRHDLEPDEKVYAVDRPLGTAKTLAQLPKVICEAALQEIEAHESSKRG